MKFLNDNIRIFLVLVLVSSIIYSVNNLNITGNVHLSKDIKQEYPTELYLNSDPDGANIYISGGFAGQTPQVFTSLEPNRYEIVLKKVNYYDKRESVDLEKNRQIQLNLDMTRVGEGNIFIKSNIDNADIYINNKLAGITPKKISLEEGIYDIKISKKNYFDFFTIKSIKAGQNYELFTELPKLEHGTLFIESQPQEARILINNQYLGKTPSTLTLEKGKHLVKVEKDGYDTKIFEFDINKDKRDSFSFNLEPSLGTLLVTSAQQGAKIYIDGEYKGVTPKIVTDLRDGFHTLKLSKEYYIDYLDSVNVKRLHPNSVYINLQRK